MLVMAVLYLSVTEEHGASLLPAGERLLQAGPHPPFGHLPPQAGEASSTAGEHWAARSSASPARALEPLSRPRTRAPLPSTHSSPSPAHALEPLSRRRERG
ncbi:hypothetical protein XACLE20_130080 [Xanthomonas citri pv. citri]|nr:hypothetical protein XACLE20_130080 [Xanthomonas citri pv. citri]CEH43209.1 hypothetical protein XACLE3_420024 [Xanthomonas citri pv. citri]